MGNRRRAWRGRLWSARAGAHALCSGLGPVRARRRVAAARTGAQLRGALAPRSRGSKLAALGPGLRALSALKRRARLLREPAASGVLAQSRCGYFSHIATVSLQRGCSRTGKVGARTLEPRFGRLPKPTGLSLGFKSGKKRVKQVTYPWLLVVQLEIRGAPRVQPRVLDTGSETSGWLQRGARSAPPSNKPLATWALPTSSRHPREPSPAHPGSPASPGRLAEPTVFPPSS